MEDFKKEVTEMLISGIEYGELIVDWNCMDTTKGLFCEVVTVTKNHNVVKYAFVKDGEYAKLVSVKIMD